MGFQTDDGLDDVERKLKELEYGLTEEGIQEWVRKVESWTRAICDGKADGVKIAVKKVGSKIDLDTVVYVKEERECLKKAIQTNLSQMPETTRVLFSTLLAKLEQS
jgi:hypothetical protein